MLQQSQIADHALDPRMLIGPFGHLKHNALSSQALCLLPQLSSSLKVRAMDTIGEVRRANLELLIARAGTMDAVAAAVGSSSVYLSQIKNRTKDVKHKKPREMGSAMARRCEAGFDLPAGWMDWPNTSVPDPAPNPYDETPDVVASDGQARMTAGETLSLAAKATAGLSASRRKAIAALAAEMIENGPSPDEIASIDALAPGLFLDSVTSETTLKTTLLKLAHEHPDRAKREIITEFLNQAMLFITEQKRINVTPAATNVRAAV